MANISKRLSSPMLEDPLSRPVTIRDLLSFKKHLVDKILQVIGENMLPDYNGKWAKTHQVCKILGCCSGKVYSMRSAGLLPAKKVGGTIYYDVVRIRALLTDPGFQESVHLVKHDKKANK